MLSVHLRELGLTVVLTGFGKALQQAAHPEILGRPPGIFSGWLAPGIIRKAGLFPGSLDSDLNSGFKKAYLVFEWALKLSLKGQPDAWMGLMPGSTGVGLENETDMTLGQAWSLGPQGVILELETVDDSLVPRATGTGPELGLYARCPGAGCQGVGLESMSSGPMA